MNNPLSIIAELKNVLYWSQPNIKHDEMLSLINALENALSPTEETIVEEPVVEIVEETVVEELTVEEVIEETVTEEPTVEVVAPKTTTRKK